MMNRNRAEVDYMLETELLSSKLYLLAESPYDTIFKFVDGYMWDKITRCTDNTVSNSSVDKAESDGSILVRLCS